MNKNFKPFKNESDCIELDGLTIENRLDMISIFGSIDLTLDKNGLKIAKELKTIIDSTIKEMERTNLPDAISIVEPDTVDNPF